MIGLDDCWYLEGEGQGALSNNTDGFLIKAIFERQCIKVGNKAFALCATDPGPPQNIKNVFHFRRCM